MLRPLIYKEIEKRRLRTRVSVLLKTSGGSFWEREGRRRVPELQSHLSRLLFGRYLGRGPRLTQQRQTQQRQTRPRDLQNE